MLVKNLRRIRLSNAACLDIEWWNQFARRFNGRSAISNELYPYPLISDSSFKGFGAYLARDWVVGTWAGIALIADPPQCSHIGPRPDCLVDDSTNINVLELWPVLVGLKRWGRLFEGRSVQVLVDNTQVMHLLKMVLVQIPHVWPGCELYFGSVFL